MKKQRAIPILLIAFLSSSFLLAEEFSKEKAFEHIKYLAETIGPRPMGSPQEKEALSYTAEKLAEYGCQVEWQYISQSENLNTNSGNVIGRLPGQTEREIVIGAHIDSAGPEIPGANDDASGVAAFLEVARVLSQEPRHSTLVFVAFGGEESGLVGSKHFAEIYPLENVALMLQLDMTSNDSPLILWLDTPEHQSPEWLVSASIETYHALGYRNIDYPTHFQSLNGSLGGAGSDHEPFMKKGIPAIAFVSDVSFPIHTRNDSVEYFQIDGLERSGKLVLELIRKFDQGQPEKNKGNYMLLLFREKAVFVTPFLMVAFIILSIAVSLIALYITRRKRKGFEEDKKIRLSWPKLSVLFLIILIVITLSDWVLKLLKGSRFYWYAHPGPHLLYILPFAVLGIWLALQLLWRWRLRKDVFFYLIRAAVYLLVLTFLVWKFVNPRLALYPASGLLLISLGCLVPWGWLKGLLWLLSPYMMLRVLFIPQYYGFVYRSVAYMGMQLKTLLGEIIFSGILILIMVIFSMPFLLGFAAIYRSYPKDLLWLKRFRHKVALIPVGGLILLCSAYLMTLPSYTSTWEQVVSVTQKYDSTTNSSSIEFSSFDYLKGIGVDISGQQEIINIGKSYRKTDYPLGMDWIKDSVSCRVEEEGEEKILNLDALLEFEKQPFTVNIKFECDEAITVDECSVKYNHRKDNRITIRWYSFPPKSLNPQLRLRVPKEAELKAEITATFLETPMEIRCEGENKHFIHRASITKDIDLLQEGENAKTPKSNS